MNLFFVGDNRTNVNWGRGASLALGQLLSDSFEITGRITGDYFSLSTADVGYVGTLLPPPHYPVFRHLLRNSWRKKVGLYLKVEKWYGAHDFISENPTVSVDNLLKHKDHYPQLDRIYREAAQADLVVLDGDGDIVFSTPPRRQTLFLLAMIELGIRLKKPVFLVNSMISDCPVTGRNVGTVAAARRLMGQCKAVILRDPESLEYVRSEMPECNASLIPDSLFAWFPRYSSEHSHPPYDGDFLLPHPEIEDDWGKLDFSKPYICIGGGAQASSRPDDAVRSYGKLIDALSELGYPIYLTENDEPDSFLRRVAREKGIGLVPANAPILMCGAVLANARLFLSGRYHPSIFASLGGTPCIFMASHAHKMGSLSRVLEYEVQKQFTAIPGDAEVSEIVLLARDYLDQGDSLRARIRAVTELRYQEAITLPAVLKSYMGA